MATAQNDEKEELRFVWMWDDVNLLAPLNPMRWSEELSYTSTLESLGEYENNPKYSTRPVKLSIAGESYCHHFESPKCAMDWLRNCNPNGSQGQLAYSVISKAGTLLASPALSLFLRTNSDRPWIERNLIQAFKYSHQVTSIPLDLAKKQSVHSGNPSKEACGRKAAVWKEFENIRPFCLLITNTNKPIAEREKDISINNESWTIYEKCNEEFFCAYTCDNRAIIVCRGGDGGVEDSKHHFGSPARAFIHDVELDEVPHGLNFSKIDLLSDSYNVEVLGYSQGGITALAFALKFIKNGWFTKCTLLNAATMFWPLWMDTLLPEGDWWVNGFETHPEWNKFDSWVIENDPLSEGIPGGSLRAPLVPGITKVLPTKAVGMSNWIENHALAHFLPISEEN